MNIRSKRIRWAFFVMVCFIGMGTVGFKLNLFTGNTANTSQVYAAQGPAGVEGPEGNSKDTIQSGTPLIPVTGNQSAVAIVQSREAKAENIKYEEIRTMVRTAVEMAGGFQGLIKNGQTVVIKPNLVTPIDYTLPGWGGRPLAPEVNGTTTDYRVTRAVVELVRRYNPDGKVYIMEGSAFPTRECMKQLNYTPKFIPGVDEFVCIEEDSGNWRDFNSSRIVKVPVPDHLLAKEVYMNRRYKEADVVISVPALKNHWNAVTSGSIKNVSIGATPATIYGGGDPGMLNRGGGIDHTKEKLDKWIHDWFMARPVDFTIMDGLQGIQNGPTPSFDMSRTSDIRQDQMNTRLILASRDCVAMDSIESLVMEVDPKAVTYLGYLEKSGAGKSDVAAIRVVGKRVDEVRKNFKGILKDGKFTDLIPPRVTIKKTYIRDDTFFIQLAAAEKTAKIEISSEDKYLGFVVPVHPDDFCIAMKGIGRSMLKKDITLYLYDKYLNCAIKRVRVE